MEENSFV